MKVGKPFFLISVSKAEQHNKQEKLPSGILLAPKFLDMRYNLQCGTIIDIGEKAQKEFPGAQNGDILVFKHIIESQKWRILEKVPNPETHSYDEHLIVDIRSGSEIYAIVKPSGAWIINRTYVFLHPDVSLIQNTEYKGILSVPNPEIYLEESYVMDKLDTLKADMENLQQTVECETDSYKFEVQYGAMQKIANEQAQLSSFLHATKFCKAKVMMAHPEIMVQTGIRPDCEIFIDNKILYDLDLGNLGRFKVCFARHITGIFTQSITDDMEYFFREHLRLTLEILSGN